MEKPKQKSAFKQQSDDELNTQAASFIKTYESIEALFGSKITKLIALKSLVVAEAKLSLSAILLSFAISLTLVVVAAMVWILLNIGVGLICYEFIGSTAISIIILIAINALLGLWLFKQLKTIWKLVGFSSIIANITEGD